MVSPKYARVQSGIINLIASENIKTGEMLPTEKQLSECFDVSIITIRRAVKHLEDNNIVRREQGRGTFVISDIQGRADNGTIVFLDILRKELSFSSFNPSVKKLDSELSRRGYRLSLLVAGQKPDAEAIGKLKDTRGVIITGWVNSKWVQILNALDIPMIFLGGIVCDPLDIPMVIHDWRLMAEMLARHLFENGARKIGLLLGGDDYAPSALMRDGLASVLRSRGEKLDPSTVLYSDSREEADATSMNIGKFLRGSPDIDGLLIEAGCYVHVLNNLFESRRRPLMGVMSVKAQFGNVCRNTWEAAFSDEIDEIAVKQLLELIHSGKKKIEDIKLKPYMVSNLRGGSDK